MRRPPRSTLDRSSAASDVYKRQASGNLTTGEDDARGGAGVLAIAGAELSVDVVAPAEPLPRPVSYTHLRAHETVLDLVCRLLLEKKTTQTNQSSITISELTASSVPPHGSQPYTTY